MLVTFGLLITICLLVLLFYKIYYMKYQKELKIFIDRAFAVRKGMSYDEVVNIFNDNGDFSYIKLQKEPVYREEEYYWKNRKYSRFFGSNATFVAKFENNVLVNSNLSSSSLYLD